MSKKTKNNLKNFDQETETLKQTETQHTKIIQLIIKIQWMSLKLIIQK